MTARRSCVPRGSRTHIPPTRDGVPKNLIQEQRKQQWTGGLALKETPQHSERPCVTAWRTKNQSVTTQQQDETTRTSQTGICRPSIMSNNALCDTLSNAFVMSSLTTTHGIE
eukprot:2406606-Amphidinium_carterae.1